MNRIFANKADADLNQSSDLVDNKSSLLKINFKNCIQVFSRSMEELLLLQTKIKSSIDRVYKFIIGRNQKESKPGLLTGFPKTSMVFYRLGIYTYSVVVSLIAKGNEVYSCLIQDKFKDIVEKK